MTHRAVELIGTTDWGCFGQAKRGYSENAEEKKIERTWKWQLNHRRQRLHNSAASSSKKCDVVLNTNAKPN
jgi:hypothetical protein